MAQITWDEVGERKFYAGLDRGVFYADGVSVPWNGLISVDTKQEGVSAIPIYFDDRKVNELLVLGDFSATMTAYTYPDEFLPFDGYAEPVEGMYIESQDRAVFGLCYRTLVGNDVDGIDLGYKLHLVYNLTAIPDTVPNKSIDSNVEPITFSWSLTSVPDVLPRYRPSSHLIIDSTKVDPDVLATLEEILYGTESDDPRLPSIFEVYSNIALTIIDNGDGSWDIMGPEAIVSMVDADSFTVTSDTITMLDADSYTIS